MYFSPALSAMQAWPSPASGELEALLGTETLALLSCPFICPPQTGLGIEDNTHVHL